MIVWIVTIIGSLVLAVAVWSGYSNYRWLVNAEAVPGEVIEMVSRSGSKGGSTYAPRVRYIVNGETREFVSSLASNPPAYRVGDVISVAVNLEKDKQCIMRFGELYGFPVVGTLLSLAILGSMLLITNGSKLLQILHPQLVDQ